VSGGKRGFGEGLFGEGLFDEGLPGEGLFGAGDPAGEPAAAPAAPAGAGTAPSSWAGLAGQDRVAAVLRPAAAAPGDAYLFTGPPGTGKERAALAFAAAILCPAGGCGVCSACSRVLRGIHPDVFVLEPEGYTYPIEAIREAVAQAALSPMEGSRRVIVVQEADRIAERSQNALLKALEEPNPSVTWVLVSSVLPPVLPTILSRCQVVEFTALAEAAVVDLVRAGSSSPEAAVLTAVRAARGEADRAIGLAAGGPAAALRSLAIDTALEAARPPEGRRAFLLAGRVAGAAQAARQAREEAAAAELAALEESLGSGRGNSRRGTAGARKRLGDRAKRAARRAENEVYLDFCGWLAQTYRDLAVLAAGAGPEAVSAPDRLADLAAAARSRPLGAWLRLAEDAAAGAEAIRQNAQPALAVEAVLLAPLALGGELGEPAPARP
jgi:DNA polymerase-3 subunit delta'